MCDLDKNVKSSLPLCSSLHNIPHKDRKTKAGLAGVKQKLNTVIESLKGENLTDTFIILGVP